jgi:hypothetical protein
MTETIPVELQELTERAKVAFARAHPKCARLVQGLDRARS